MTTLRLYPSLLPGQPIETYEHAGTLRDLLLQFTEYRDETPHYPVVASIAGEALPREAWGDARTIGATIDMVPVPGILETIAAFVVQAIVAAVVSMALQALFGKKASGPDTRSPREMAFANAQGNEVRLNQVIPDLAGRIRRRYMDLICQPRTYFIDKRTQGVDLMLCVGRGSYLFHAKRIGDTEFEEFGETLTAEVFPPGATVSGHQAHRNWYNCSNVGPTLGGTGIRLTAGTSASDLAEADSYRITGSSIIVPPGAGAMPQDWEVDTKVTIFTYARSIEVVDGGGTTGAPNRDIVCCDLTGVSFSVGDVIEIDGTEKVDGRYRIHSLTTGIVEAGSASSITGAIVASLNYAASPVTVDIAGQACVLDDDYADAAALVAAIAAQVAGVTVAQTGGVVSVTDVSPFDGRAISLAGNYAPLFGATPYFVTGTATRSYDEMTLDRWGTAPGSLFGGEPVEGWQPAASMTPGAYSGVELYRPREVEVTTGTPPFATTTVIYAGPEYRITALVSGTLPDGDTGTVGFTFQRLLPDGADDTSWAGFFPEVTTTEAVIQVSDDVVGGWSGWFDVSPRGDDVLRAEYDLFFPSGLVRYNREGKRRSHTATIEVQYRIDGGAAVSTVHEFRDSTPDQIGYTYGIDLPAGTKNVQMRARRIKKEVNDSAYSDRVEWYGARTLLTSATSYPGVTTMALTITGSDVMSAQSQTQVNVDVTRLIDGVPTRSIADYARYVLADVGYPAGRIDTDEFDRLDAIWAARGEYFDYEHVEQLNARDVLSRILRAGMAEFTVHRGLFLPVRDEPRTAPAHSYSRLNMRPGSFRRSFVMPRESDRDGVDVIYRDAETWAETLIECRLPGDLGLRAERLTLEGVTSRTQAWRIGMRRRREMAFRRWEYSWDSEMDGLNSYYTSLASLVPDIPGFGASAILRSYTIAGADLVLRVSEPFDFSDEAATYVVSWRMATGLRTPAFLASPGASPLEIIAADVATEYRPVIVPGQVPPHVYFGTATTMDWPAIVTEVQPDGLYRTKLKGTNYAVEVYADDDNVPA